MHYRWLAAGCAMAFIAGARAADSDVFIHSLMKDAIAPQAQVLWDVGNKAMDDDGNPDVSKLTASDWSRLGGAAQAMRTAALLMADAPKLQVAPPGIKLQDEGAPGVATAREIQGFIDADPKGFADHARALAVVSDGFLEATRTRKAQTLGDASAKLDEVCEACHVKYWYPNQ